MKIYLFEIKHDFLGRIIYWFISLPRFPSGKHVSVWEEIVECRGNAPAPQTNHGQLEMGCKEALRGEKNCLHCWWVVLRSNAKFSTEKKIKKNKKSWQRVDNSVQFIWRVFGNCSVFKCLNHGLSVKLNRYFSCRAGYMHLCNMKINLLKSPFLCLVYPPAVLISLVSPSDFMSSKWWRFPHSKYIANCWAIELPYQMEIKLGKIMVTKIEKKIIWSFTFYSKLKRNNRKGQQTKQHSCKD